MQHTCKWITYPHHRALADRFHSGLYILPCTWCRCCHSHRSHSWQCRVGRCTVLGQGRTPAGNGLCSDPGTKSALSRLHLEMSLTFNVGLLSDASKNETGIKSQSQVFLVKWQHLLKLQALFCNVLPGPAVYLEYELNKLQPAITWVKC